MRLIARNSSVALLLLAGCTSVQVQPVAKEINLKHVCIRENPKVKVDDFLAVLKDGFNRHHITTEVITHEVPANCEYILSYTALRSWDIAPYLADAELTLENRDGQRIAHAMYHLVSGGWDLNPTKYQGTKTKMDPVIDELLKSY